MDPKTEWFDRHYQEHKRKQTQMGGPRGEETWQLDGQSESQNGYPMEIKDLEADQEQDGATNLIQYVGPTWSHIARDRKLWQACREGFSLGREKHPEWWWDEWLQHSGPFLQCALYLTLITIVQVRNAPCRTFQRTIRFRHIMITTHFSQDRDWRLLAHYDTSGTEDTHCTSTTRDTGRLRLTRILPLYHLWQWSLTRVLFQLRDTWTSGNRNWVH